jgi:hypothetical protein
VTTLIDRAVSDIAQKSTWYCLPPLSAKVPVWKSICQIDAAAVGMLTCAEVFPTAAVELSKATDADWPPSVSRHGERDPVPNPPLTIRFGSTVSGCVTGGAAA